MGVDLFKWVQGVRVDELPPAPLRLNSATVVLDPGRWLDKIKADARLGANGPRGKYMAIHEDIRLIYRLVKGDLKW